METACRVWDTSLQAFNSPWLTCRDQVAMSPSRVNYIRLAGRPVRWIMRGTFIIVRLVQSTYSSFTSRVQIRSRGGPLTQALPRS